MTTTTNNNIDINEVLQELKEYDEMMKALKVEIDKLQDEAKEYMTDNNLTEVFSDDKSIVARYNQVVTNRFDTSAFKKSEWSELYDMYIKQVTSMRFTLN
jgi:N-dimethylarginine dimethylaminohydrolase